MNVLRSALGLWVCGTLALALPACSVNPKANPSYGCTGCKGQCINNFCVLADGGRANPDASGADAAAHDASADAAATDAGKLGDAAAQPGDASAEAGADAAAADACSKDGDTKICYSSSNATLLHAPCHVGLQTCKKGHWSACAGEQGPVGEGCNNIDDDCDGIIDEDLKLGSCPVPGQLANTPCAAGTWQCLNGGMLCPQAVQPVTDSCNKVDDDCDGTVDEDTDEVCYKYTPSGGPAGCTANGAGGYTCVGACKSGVNHCINGVLQTTCPAQTTPVAEACTNSGQLAQDENCNGTVDENCSCTNNTYDCYTGPVSPVNTALHSPCHKGTQACTGGSLGTCMNEALPGTETCNNIDDDCNGVTDDVPMLGTACTASALGNCMNGTRQCASGALACQAGLAAAQEACDGADDDCDGNTDEGFDLQTDENNCGACGTICTTGFSCCGGKCIDPKSNAANCGGCGSKCGSGSSCCAGGCVNTATSGANCGACGVNCGSSGACCTSVCKNIKTDNNNCGSCGHACGALSGCSNGGCALLGG